MQNLKRFSVKRVRLRERSDAVLNSRYNWILVIIEPGCSVGARGRVYELIAPVWNDLRTLHAFFDTKLDEMIASAKYTVRPNLKTCYYC
jgi:hypothetical protein